MASNSWSPEGLGIPSRQNFLLWKDMERAYNYVESHARYSISGDVEGFLFELVRRRWNLACADVYEPHPEISELYDKRFQSDPLSMVPPGLTLTNIDRLSLTNNFLNEFIEFSAKLASNPNDQSGGKLYGYGTDGYGTYIPLHLLWSTFRKYWGIYISETGVLTLAAVLYRGLAHQMYLFSKDKAQQIERLIQVAYQVILRHQLFHFKVEQWTLLFELATGRASYLPYLQYVYLPTLYDSKDGNLEEALANLSILLSKKIQKIQKEVEFDITSAIVRDFLDHQGSSYRNYELRRGVPDDIEQNDRELRYRDVVNYLCNQIIQQEPNPKKPLVPYYLYPPNNNFLRAESLCPIYLVRNLSYKVQVIA